MVEVDEDAERKAEIKRTARYEALGLLHQTKTARRVSQSMFLPGRRSFYVVAEKLAMFLAHGSQPTDEEMADLKALMNAEAAGPAPKPKEPA